MRNTLLPQARSRVREMLRIPWVVSEENTPIGSGASKEITLFATICTWYESDVVYATIKNAFTQGCDRVFIIDNNSPDNTIEEALSAGATLARVYETKYLDERTKTRMINELMLEVSQCSRLKTIWWLWLDTDEFPEGPGGLSIKEFLASLHPKFRVVGAKNVNHFPVDLPHYIPRFHPLEFQPWCEEFTANEWAFCRLAHLKHPLIKYDKNEPLMTRARGQHTAFCRKQLIEPTEAIILHHFPYRDKDATHRRLEAACTSREDGTSRMQMFEDIIGHASGIRKRYLNLENVYSGRWEEVDNLHLRPPTTGVNLRLWEHPVTHRWYSDEDLRKAREEHR